MGGFLRGGLLAGALAAAVLSMPLAAADPATDPVPPVPTPDQFLGPLDQLAPVTLLEPQTYRMPDGSVPSPYVLTQGVPPGPFALINGLQGLHALLHGSMGRMPGEDLGAALPGTAPPAGTALPPGLEQYLPEPVPPPQPAG